MGGAAAVFARGRSWRGADIADEPTSRLAIWARRLALFSLAVTVLSIVIVRSGLLEIVPALATFAAALMFAALGACCSRSAPSS